MNWRYDVYFPDGYCILLVEFRNGRVSLGFHSDEFPEELKRKYPQTFQVTR